MAKKNNGSTNHNGVKKTKKTIDPKHTTTAGTITAPKQPPHTATVFHLTGHVTERGGGQGLAGLRVEAVDKDLKYEQPLGNAHTDDQGRYEITFNADRIGKAEKGGPDIVIRVFDKNGAALGVSDLFRNAGTEVTIDLPVVPKETATIREIATALHLHLPAALITGLAEHGIRTLGDIRSAGGLSRIEGLTVAPEDPALQIVEAHAQLNLLPSDLAVNAMLIERGYTSLADMANVSRQTFVASLGSSLEVSGAEALHAAATAQTRFLENTIAAFRVNTSDRAEAKYSAVIEEVMPPTCGCENCKSATSPMAYLADLLDYALRHLKHNGAAVTLTFLQDRFHQPFRDLPATCEQMEKKVRQVRICIEVLRQHLPAPDATLTSHWYLETAYATLLQKIGTSFDEIRQMCSVRDPKTREAFAAHLGIILDAQRSLPNHPDELDRLFLDTDFKSPAFPVWPRKLSEQELEQLFGLRDTKRPALDPDVIPEVLIWRMHYLRLSWHEADRSATPPLGEYPIIDPDIVGYSDLKDTTPAPTPRSPSDKPSWRALDFLEDRQQWVATKMTYLEQSRKNFEQSRKNSGLTLLLDALQTNAFLPGETGMEGITVPVLLDLRERKQGGEDVVPHLRRLRLDEDAFDYLSHIAELDRNGVPIMDSEWKGFYSIIVQRIKRYVQYEIWRKEEQDPSRPDSGITLSPDYFRVRPSELKWTPNPRRSSDAARQNWERTLRSRIKQEQAVITGLREAVDSTEEVVLVPLRDQLLDAARTVGHIHLRTPNELTGYLQIDVQAGGCHITTRVAQAIESVQGLLFGARNGLLEDDSLALDADNFDEEWKWIGSYATWRAAMQVFLYPENALRPTLLKGKSEVFEVIIQELRDFGRYVTATNARAQAVKYDEYFRDICSLSVAGLCQTTGVISGDTPFVSSPSVYGTSDVFAVGRAGQSGKFYFSVWKRLPGWDIKGSPDQTAWKAVQGLPPNNELSGLLPYHNSQGDVEIGMYFRARKGSVYEYHFATYAEAKVTAASLLDDCPALVQTAQYSERRIPCSPSLSAKKGTPWQLRADDQLVAIDVDGDGRVELILFAAQAGPGGKRVGLVREHGGGLVLDWEGVIESGWRVPNEKQPVILPSPSWQVMRLLMVNPSGPQGPRVGTLGWVNGNLQLMNGTSVIAGPAGSWTVSLGSASDPTAFVRANLDGQGDKVVVFEHKEVFGEDYSGVFRTTATVLKWANDKLVFFKAPQDMLHTQNYNTRIPLSTANNLAVKWERFIPVRRGFHVNSLGEFGTDSFEDVLVVAERLIHNPDDETRPWLTLLRWNTSSERFISPPVGLGLYLGKAKEPGHQGYGDGPHDIPAASGQQPWTVQLDDQFYPIDLGDRNQHLLAFSPSRAQIGILTYKERVDVELEVSWRKSDSLDPAVPAGEGWSLSSNDQLYVADVDGDGISEIMIVHADSGRIGILAPRSDRSLEVRSVVSGKVHPPGSRGQAGWQIQSNARYFAADIKDDGYQQIIAFASDGAGPRLAVLQAIPPPLLRRMQLRQTVPASFGPRDAPPLDVLEPFSQSRLIERKKQIEAAYTANMLRDGQGNAFYDEHGNPLYIRQHTFYLDEAYYFVPMELGLRLCESGNYKDALDSFRSVYDYDQPPDKRKIAYKLVLDAGEPDFERALDWLQDPLDPHAIAETRKNSYTKFTILAIVRCLLDFADAEFTRATSESIPRARELYLTALGLLDSPEMKQHVMECSDLIGQLVFQIGSEEEIWTSYEIRETLRQVKSVEKLAAAVERLRPLLLSNSDLPVRLSQAQKIVAETVNGSTEVSTFASIAVEHAKVRRAAAVAVLMDPATANAVERIGASIHGLANGVNGVRLIGSDSQRRSMGTANHALESISVERVRGGFVPHYVPAPSIPFCIPPNGVIQAARSHAELNLNKIRTCRNIAGMELRPEPYVTPTAAESSLQTLGSGDQLSSVRSLNFQPLPYRYATLIERTKQLVDLARQMETSMLSFITSADQEKYQEIKARQDLALTQAGVRLKDLQLTQADDGIVSARLQRDRAQIQAGHYSDLLSAGWSLNEELQMANLIAADLHQHAAAISAWVEAAFTGSYTNAISTSGSAWGMNSQIHALRASFERRAQEWKTAKDLAEQDVSIGQQQIRLAQDQVHVVTQERAISALQVDHAEQILDFLTTKKFTGYDLYEWMSGVMEQVYRFFLQQATSMAQVAERQLAFERQEIPATFIQADYWEPPSQGQSPDFSPPSVNGQTTNLRGLTGSARLLRDVYELDQYAFLKNQRKLQLTETLSLGQLDPFAFQRFRETGVLVFATPMSLFDHKFPGHYLRLVKRVRTSVIALIPPIQGIRATLSTTGTSRAVIGNDAFDTVMIQRGSESVALTSPINATGLFELDPQPELLVPFEGIGVDTTWEFRLPKASNLFDYRTIADVLITIEYTALDSFDYRQQVILELDRRVSADRAFSFRQQFPDAWYDLHNPDQTADPMTVTFETSLEDFPPNLELLEIQHVALYFAPSDEKPMKIKNVELHFTFTENGQVSTVGGSADTDEGIVSTRRGNGALWGRIIGKKPVGQWDLKLDKPTVRALFDDTKKDYVTDILFVTTYAGRTAEWPA